MNMISDEQNWAIRQITGLSIWQICISEFRITLNVGVHRIVFSQSFEIIRFSGGETKRICIPVDTDSVASPAFIGILGKTVKEISVDFPNGASIDLGDVKIRIDVEEPGEIFNLWFEGYSSPVTLL